MALPVTVVLETLIVPAVSIRMPAPLEASVLPRAIEFWSLSLAAEPLKAMAAYRLALESTRVTVSLLPVTRIPSYAPLTFIHFWPAASDESRIVFRLM